MHEALYMYLDSDKSVRTYGTMLHIVIIIQTFLSTSINLHLHRCTCTKIYLFFNLCKNVHIDSEFMNSAVHKFHKKIMNTYTYDVQMA